MAVAQVENKADTYRNSEKDISPKEERIKINLPSGADTYVKEASQKKFEAPAPPSNQNAALNAINKPAASAFKVSNFTQGSKQQENSP